MKENTEQDEEPVIKNEAVHYRYRNYNKERSIGIIKNTFLILGLIGFVYLLIRVFLYGKGG